MLNTSLLDLLKKELMFDVKRLSFEKKRLDLFFSNPTLFGVKS